MKQQRALALIAIPVALITACGSQDQQRTAGNDPLPQTLSASSKPAAAPRPAQVVQERVCGAFDALTASRTLNRPGSAGGSGYWIPTRGWAVRWAS